MIIGIPKEIKNREFRVGLLPKHIRELAQQGHTMLVEKNAGHGVGMSDEEYAQAGATICNVSEIFEQAEMIVKVKEPQANEIEKLRPEQILFTYLHVKNINTS
jgi:alanine dehydrogenase